MCCFSGEVKVSDTQIFARLSDRGTQLLAYQMQYEAKEPVAMILPLPVALPAHADTVRFISLQHIPEFFALLDRAFPRPKALRGVIALSAGDGGTLQVHEVGDFIASFVPTQHDFSRLDPRFVLPSTVWAKLPIYLDYGFAVFQLKEGVGKPHPMAFEFSTRLTDSLFFPTVHIHDGKVHMAETFDHSLYFQGESTRGVASASPLGAFFTPDQAGELVEREQGARKWELRGFKRNRDTFIDLESF